MDEPSVKKGLSVIGAVPKPERCERSDAARNRAKILEAARTLLQEKPIDQICMDAIAERAGVGKGTLYRRFPERADLYLALLDEDTRLLQEEVLAGFDLAPETSQVERLVRLLMAILDLNLRNAELLSFAWASQRSGPDRYDHPGHVWQRMAASTHLRLAIKNEEIRPLDFTLTAELLVASIHPDLIRWFLQQGLSRPSLEGKLKGHWMRAIGLKPD